MKKRPGGIVLKGSDQQLRQKVIGRFLKKAREDAGMTQWDLAKLLHYSTAQFVSNWERGVSAPPNDALPIIAKAYNLGQRELLKVMNEYTDLMAEEEKRRRAQVFRAS